MRLKEFPIFYLLLKEKIKPIAIAMMSTVSITLAQAAELSQEVNLFNKEVKEQWDDFKLFGTAGKVEISSVLVNQKRTDLISQGFVGVSATGESLVNRNNIFYTAPSTVNLTVKQNADLSIPGTSDFFDSNGENDWVLNLPGADCQITPSSIFNGVAQIDIATIGISVINGEAVNEAAIDLKADTRINLAADTKLTLSTENTKPNSLPSNLGEISYLFQPVVNTNAIVNNDISLIGMQAQTHDLGVARAVNKGAIKIRTSYEVKTDSNTEIQNEIENFNVTAEQGGYLKVETDTSQVGATTKVSGRALALGMFGITSDNSVLEIKNEGLIEITAAKEYTTAAIALSLTDNGVALVSQTGDIRLSRNAPTDQTQRSAAQNQFMHQLYADIQGNGQVVMGDWFLDLAETSSYAPFALRTEKDSNGKLLIARDSSFFLKPDRIGRNPFEIEVGPLFYLYEDEAAANPDLTHIEGALNPRSSSSMIELVSISGPDMNHLKAKFDLRPKNSLGHITNYSALSSNFDLIRNLNLLTGNTLSEEGRENWSINVQPWASFQRDSSSTGYHHYFGGLILRGDKLIDKNKIQIFGAAGFGKLKGHSGIVKNHGNHYVLGGSFRHDFNDSLFFGGRFMTGLLRTTWNVFDNLGSDAEKINSHFFYGEANGGVALSLSDTHKINASGFAGFLKIKQNDFSYRTTGTGLVQYDDSHLTTGLIGLRGKWSGSYEVDGYRIRPSVGISAAMLTNSDFKTKFLYSNLDFSTYGRLSRYSISEVASIGFTKDKFSLDAFAVLNQGKKQYGGTFNIKASYNF